MPDTKHFPRLYGEGSKGGTKEWEISVVLQTPDGHPEHNFVEIWVEFGASGAKMHTTTKIIAEGKNIGRVNETTPWEQACTEAQSDWDKKVKKGYRESIEQLLGTMSSMETPLSKAVIANIAGKPILPMLAHSYEKRKHDIQWPALAQAKIDGHRAYGTGGKLLSRGGDPVPGLVNMPHIQAELNKLAELLPEGTWYDGELYTEAIPFEKLSGCIRRARLVDAAVPLLPLVKYYLFDLFKPGDPEWSDLARYEVAEKAFFSKIFSHIKIVPQHIVRDEAELMERHNQFVQDGFEGAIIRNIKGLYKIGHRSADLQKFKMFKDAEFPIIGFKEGTGSDAGSVVWMCDARNIENPDFELSPFEVRPTGSLEYRRDLFNHGQEYIGKMLKVRYQNLTEYGIPRFPVGKGIRETGE